MGKNGYVQKKWKKGGQNSWQIEWSRVREREIDLTLDLEVRKSAVYNVC